MKTCIHCGKEFIPECNAQKRCKECPPNYSYKEREKAYYQEHKKEILEKRKDYYQENKEYIKKRERDSRKEGGVKRDYIIEYNQNYYQKNKEKALKRYSKHRTYYRLLGSVKDTDPEKVKEIKGVLYLMDRINREIKK